MANTDGDKPVIHVIKKPVFKRPNKRQAVIGIIVIAALINGGYVGYLTYKDHQNKAKTANHPPIVPQTPIEDLPVVQAPAPDPNYVNNVLATKRAEGTVVSVNDTTLTVKVDGANKVYKLTDNTLYQTGDLYANGKKEEVTAGKTVQIIYNEQTSEASAVWYK